MVGVGGDEASASAFARVPQDIWLDAHHRRWMRWLSVGVPPVLLLQAASQHFVYELPGAALALGLAAVPIAFTHAVTRRFSVEVGFQFFASLLIGAIALTSFFRGGFFLLIGLWMLLPPFGALLLGLRKAGIFWGAAVVAIEISLFLLERAGLTPPRVETPQLLALVNLSTMAAILIGPAAYGIRNLEIRQRVLAETERELARERRLESLGRFAGGVAHDLNNLLAVIRASAEYLRPEQESQLEAREDILEAVTRGAELTGGLLALAREEDRTGEPTDLGRALPRVAALARRLLPRSVKLEVGDVAGGWIDVGSGALDRAILNLCSNARDAMPDGGTIRLESDIVFLDGSGSPPALRERPGRYARIRVVDDGHGMDAETRGKIFEPFFSTKAASRTGTGLGLASVAALVAEVRGAVEVDSEPGRGTRLSLFLPLMARAPRTNKSTHERHDLAARVTGLSIWVAEDDAALRRGLARLLGAVGARVRQVDRSADLDPSGVDVLLCALDLAGGGGVAFAQQLLSRKPTLRVVFLSGQAGERAIAGVRVLPKPCSRESLLEAVVGEAVRSTARTG